MLRALGMLLAGYAVIVISTSLVSPQRVVAIGSDQCSDDWCIAVTGVARADAGREATLTVTFRLSTRARRISQRERNVVAYLQRVDGQRIDALADPQAVPFDTLLAPGQTIVATRRFTVPAGIGIAGVAIVREGAGVFPACCIIGDDNSLLHRRLLVRIDPTA
jgi:hypothetical protein